MFQTIELTEARDINTHLKPLKWILEDIEEKEFNETKVYIRPLFQTICKVWSHSEYYCAPARLIVLLQEVCNLIINQVDPQTHILVLKLWFYLWTKDFAVRPFISCIIVDTIYRCVWAMYGQLLKCICKVIGIVRNVFMKYHSKKS